MTTPYNQQPTQATHGLQAAAPVATIADYTFEPIRGYPMLQWAGKRPFRSTQFYPAQHKETYGPEVDGWRNKLYWGDNLQVMSHLLKHYRGQVQLIYIDPPFDSKADYTRKITVRGQTAASDKTAFEEKQYTDIWTNDEYLQFMYERLILMRELLADEGSIYLHCDWHKSHYLRCIMDEVFGAGMFLNEIVWRRKGGSALKGMRALSTATDTILVYTKSADDYTFNTIYAPVDQDYIDTNFSRVDKDGRRFQATVMRSPNPRPNLMYDYKGYKTPPNGWAVSREKMEELDRNGQLYFPEDQSKQIYRKIFLDEYPGQPINNLWTDISTLKGTNKEIVDYPTQKPEALIERIIQVSSNPGDLVLALSHIPVRVPAATCDRAAAA